jgi:hypothetical protein
MDVIIESIVLFQKAFYPEGVAYLQPGIAIPGKGTQTQTWIPSLKGLCKLPIPLIRRQ